MRAVRLVAHGGPEALELHEVEVPSPRADEVLVRVAACGLNNTDVWTREGSYGLPGPPAGWLGPIDFPRIQGADVVGEVRRQILVNPRIGIEAAIYALMRRPDSTPDLPLVSCPALVIVGEEDTVTPIADAEALARGIRNAELAIIAKAGHLSALEAPDEFSTTITRWLGSLQ